MKPKIETWITLQACGSLLLAIEHNEDRTVNCINVIGSGNEAA